MGPERQEDLGAPTEDERKIQEHEALLVTSRRLVEEMVALTGKAKELVAKHVELMSVVKNKPENKV